MKNNPRSAALNLEKACEGERQNAKQQAGIQK
jgi:hypothetical protein